jgi:predicted NUDIX family NTP pyrophosphohydrolase
VPVRSAGILLWRRAATGDGAGEIQVLVGHMGGPLWTGKDAAAWSVPKGIYDEPEAAVDAALREWQEELGVALPAAPEELALLGEVRQPSGKRLTVWAAEGDLDPDSITPGTFTMVWPPRSGTIAEFPEIDRVEWCTIEAARPRLVAGQRVFLDRLMEMLA